MTRTELADRIATTATVTFSRSGGPGGQNVNKVSSQVTLRVPIADLALPEAEEERVRRILSNRIAGTGELVLQSSETRSQRFNRERALERAVNLIDGARRPAPQRRPTRPGKAARERRLRQKHARSQRKQRRRPPAVED